MEEKWWKKIRFVRWKFDFETPNRKLYKVHTYIFFSKSYYINLKLKNGKYNLISGRFNKILKHIYTLHYFYIMVTLKRTYNFLNKSIWTFIKVLSK